MTAFAAGLAGFNESKKRRLVSPPVLSERVRYSNQLSQLFVTGEISAATTLRRHVVVSVGRGNSFSFGYRVLCVANRVTLLPVAPQAVLIDTFFCSDESSGSTRCSSFLSNRF